MRSIFAFLLASFIFHPSCVCSAANTQAEVLKSINESMGKQVDPSKLLAVFLSVVGLIVVVAFMNYRRKRVITPKPLNHPGKLVKQVAKAIDLKPAELKQLRAIAEARDLSSPLVLLLCPSLLKKQVNRDDSA
jgi:hypothetical protein